MNSIRLACSLGAVSLGLCAALGAAGCSRPIGGAGSTESTIVVARASSEAHEVPPNDPRHPVRFAHETRARVDAITRDISNAVADGELPQRALYMADQHRENIEAMLRAYSADGYIDGNESRDVRERLEELTELRDRFDGNPTGRGGGPRDLWR